MGDLRNTKVTTQHSIEYYIRGIFCKEIHSVRLAISTAKSLIKNFASTENDKQAKDVFKMLM